MTSKLKCPFCQQELIREGMNHWWCSCNIEHQGKELYGTTALWQALIDGKKAQEALDWLNEYLTEDKVEENVAVSCQYLKAKITSITKQEE